jgi:hypothetical protein
MIHVDELNNRQYAKLPDKLAKLNFSSFYYKEYKHGGKPGYWKIIHAAYQNLKNVKFDYCIQLPDDIQLVEDFFNKAISLFKQLPNNKTCLNLLNDQRTGPNWTPVTPNKHNDHIIQTGWVDMCFIATNYFFKMLNYSISPVDRTWTVTLNKSSGVGMQISKRIYNNGYFTYMVKDSLVFHGDHQSMMHPEERNINPLISNYNINDVAAGVASMPIRVRALMDAVNSLLPQVGKLYVYLNEYERTPEFLLNNKKIIVFHSKDTAGDIGDVGKFYACNQHKGYFFTIDDDLIYPPDYVAKYICAIERHHRKAICTIHGRVYEPKEIISYYRGQSAGYRCFNAQVTELPVTVGGTGVMAWHTNTINFNLEDFQTTNMADIWAAIKAHAQKVPIMLIKHGKMWIRESPNYDNQYSIYAACCRKDKTQTEIFNKHLVPLIKKQK